MPFEAKAALHSWHYDGREHAQRKQNIDVPTTIHAISFLLPCVSALYVAAMAAHYGATFWRPEDWWWSRSVARNLHWINTVGLLGATLAAANIALSLFHWMSDDDYPVLAIFFYLGFSMGFPAMIATALWWSLELERIGPPETGISRRDYH